MKKTYQVIFVNDNYDLHTKVKSLVPQMGMSMNDFIIAAIREKIDRIEKQQVGHKESYDTFDKKQG